MMWDFMLKSADIIESLPVFHSDCVHILQVHSDNNWSDIEHKKSDYMIENQREEKVENQCGMTIVEGTRERKMTSARND